MDKIDQIRAEIERLKEKYTNMMPSIQKCSVCDELLSFIDTLKEQPVCEGLEEEIKRRLKEGEITDTRYDDYGDNDIEVTARHFAQWQKDKDIRDMYMSDNRHFEKGYELGKKDMKEQMMKEAVETWMIEGSMYEPEFIKRKVIIIKED